MVMEEIIWSVVMDKDLALSWIDTAFGLTLGVAIIFTLSTSMLLI